MVAILDFTQNAMSKNTFWTHHYMSGTPENPLVDNQIMNHYILKWRPFHLIYMSQFDNYVKQ